MGFIELLILAIGLSMDAFAVSICKGLSLKDIKPNHMASAGLWFGGFQFLMPVAGYFLAGFFTDMITKYSHWVAFALLEFLGIKMILESRQEEEQTSAMDPKTMLLMAVATSIDALAVGISFALLDVSIIPASAFIGCTTFVISAVGIKLGSLVGSRYNTKAQIAGGLILMGIGVKILLEGLGVF